MTRRARAVLAALDPEVVREISARLNTPSTRRSEREGVYVAQLGNYVKIGWSSNIRQRVATLRGGTGLRPDDLSGKADLVAVIPGTVGTERALLLAFQSEHAVGEWFYCRGHVRAWVERLRSDRRVQTASQSETAPDPKPGPVEF